MTKVARQPMAQHSRRPHRCVHGARKAGLLGCASLAFGLAAHLASAPPACAHDTLPPSAPPSGWVSNRVALPALSEPALLLPMIDPSSITPAALEPGAADAARAATAGSTASATSGSEGEAEPCEQECAPKRKSPIALLPEVILRNLNEVPILAMVMLPVTEGVTITPGEGLPAVTFSVKPTKITRGSGLVAVSRF